MKKVSKSKKIYLFSLQDKGAGCYLVGEVIRLPISVNNLCATATHAACKKRARECIKRLDNSNYKHKWQKTFYEITIKEVK
jgi:hypothetical protein